MNFPKILCLNNTEYLISIHDLPTPLFPISRNLKRWSLNSFDKLKLLFLSRVMHQFEILI